jgi:hypothetical protein
MSIRHFAVFALILTMSLAAGCGEALLPELEVTVIRVVVNVARWGRRTRIPGPSRVGKWAVFG